jgi:hypothetical protein
MIGQTVYGSKNGERWRHFVKNKWIMGSTAAVMLMTVTACSPNHVTSSNQLKQSTNTSVSANETATTQNTTPSTSATNKTVTSTIAVSKPPAGPLPGDLLIADRGNDRLLIVTPAKKIVWSMQFHVGGPHNQHSLGPDDAFFTPDYKHIIVNEEDNQVIAIIDIATKKIVWTYGHAGIMSSRPGYLHTPDDAYQLKNGTVTVADIVNQRILFIAPNGHIIKQYGTTGQRYHNPPKSFAAPNGDTPLPDGGTLVTEIGGSYADRINKNGKLVYSVHFPDISYPSDTQLLPNGNLLTVDYTTPGKIEEITPKGKVVWEYFKTSGPGMLAHPSLGLPLPNGDIVVNDDSNDRVIVIDPKTDKIVWQYGHQGVPGTAPGYLNIPDGMDFVPANVKLPIG